MLLAAALASLQRPRCCFAAALTRSQSQNPDLSQIPQSQLRLLVVVSSPFLIKATIRPKIEPILHCNMKLCSEMLLEVTVYCGKVRDQRGCLTATEHSL